MKLDTDLADKEIYLGQNLCLLFSIAYLALMPWIPSWCFTLFVLLSVTQLHYWFYHWCLSASTAEAVKERYKTIEFVTAPCALGLCAVLGDSNLIISRGLLCCVVPFLLLRNCRSRQRAVTYCVAHLCSVLFNARCMESAQWVVIAVIIYGIAFDTVQRNFVLHESHAVARSAKEIFEQMLATMCDGYLVLDVDGRIIGMDKKASTFIAPDAVAKRLRYESLMHGREADAGYELRPGLEKGQLISSDETMSLEVECYTCDCVFYPTLLPQVLGFHEGTAGNLGNTTGTSIGRYLRALKILSQVPLVKSHRCKASAQNTEALSPVRSTQDLQPSAPAAEGYVGPIPHKKEKSLPASSDGSSVTAISQRTKTTLGEKVDLMLNIMTETSRERLARCSKECSLGVMSLRRSFKALLKELMDQTEEQFCTLVRPDHVMPGDSIQDGNCVIEEEDGELEGVEHSMPQ